MYRLSAESVRWTSMSPWPDIQELTVMKAMKVNPRIIIWKLEIIIPMRMRDSPATRVKAALRVHTVNHAPML